MTYNTLNPVPSTDPRDLDDNAQAFDRFLQSTNASEPDRLGTPRKTWHQMESDAAALVSPNVSALAAVTPAVDKAVFFNAITPVGMGTYTLNAFNRSLGSTADGPAFRSAIGAIGSADSITGSAASLTTSRSIAATGDGTWSVSFNGSANVSAAFTLATTGVAAGTYGSVTVDTKGRVTEATTATPVANGGTGSTTEAGARTALGVFAQADKLAWSAYTPTVTTDSGTFTAASATGSHVEIAGICHFRVEVTVTTKGTAAGTFFSLPVPALAGTANMSMPARDSTSSGAAGVATIQAGLTTARLWAAAGTDLVTGNGFTVSIMGSYPIA